MAAAALLEAEVVTADGKVRIINACMDPDLFWSLKGGGGGTFGVITRLTLRTRELPEYFCGVFTTVKATSDAAYEKLVTWFVNFYRGQLFNPHWGEQIVLRDDNSIRVSMLCHGLSKEQAENTWKELPDLVAASPQDYSFVSPLAVIALPARHLWDAAFMKKNFPQAIMADDRPGAPEGNIFWATNLEEAGSFWHSYKSAWLPPHTEKENETSVVNALIAASKKWEVSLHFNKGLAGAPPAEISAARDTATTLPC
jgi:FAD/FMN-containing dehydrogenase